MKIKCIETRNGSDLYLTVGKVYKATQVGEGVYGWCIVRIIDDIGEVITIYMKDSGHGKFEVVE